MINKKKLSNQNIPKKERRNMKTKKLVKVHQNILDFVKWINGIN